MISVRDFVDMYTGATGLEIEIWDNVSERVLWTGCGDDIPDEYEWEMVDSYDLPYRKWCITLNINYGE